MEKFICTSEPTNSYTYKGEFMGVTEKKALFYATSLGKRRVYRRDLVNPGKEFKLFEFNSIEEAQDFCNQTNSITSNDFKPELLTHEH